MRPYLAIIRARFKVLTQYRLAAIAGTCTQLFWGYIRVVILMAFYQNVRGAQPLSLEQTITYIWLSQAFLQIIPWNMDPEVQQLVKTGNVAYELLRPIDLYRLWYCKTLAWRFIPTLLRASLIFFIVGLFAGLNGPSSVTALLAFCVSIIFALLLSTSISTLFTISLFWTISSDGLSRLIGPVTALLTGLIVPLPLFPDWAQKIVHLLPFRAVLDIPFHFYMGLFQMTDIFWNLAFQLGWTIVLVFFGQWLLKRASKVLVIQGG